MRLRAIITKSKPWFERVILLVVFWILSFITLPIIFNSNEQNTFQAEPNSNTLKLPQLRNEVVGLRYIHKENHRPIFRISLGSLRSENNKLGIFTTALHKVVQIRDLDFAFYRYSPPQIPPTTKTTIEAPTTIAASDQAEDSISEADNLSAVPEDTLAIAKMLVDNINKLVSRKDEWHVNIDLSNVSEISIINFEYKIFSDETLLLGVKGKRAMVSRKSPELVTLRGHVIVKTADGCILESNHAIWDVRNNNFTVDGTYFLSRDGKVTRGRNISVDDKLNILEAKVAITEGRDNKNG